MPRRAECDLVRRDQSAVRVHATNATAVEVEAGYLAILDQVDAHLVRFARERPGDVVVLGDATPSLQRAADHGVAHIRRDVDDRAEGFDLSRREPFSVDPAQPVRVDPPHPFPPVALAVHQAEHAALAEQNVVIELLGKVFPELQRVFVDRRALIPEVVRANDGGVAGHVAARQPAPLEHGNIRDVVILRKVVGRCQAMAASADDDDLVRAPRLRVAPQMIGMRVRFGHARCWPLYIRYGAAGFRVVAELVWAGLPGCLRRVPGRTHAGRDRSARSPARAAAAAAHPRSAMRPGPACDRAGPPRLSPHRARPVALPPQRGRGTRARDWPPGTLAPA